MWNQAACLNLFSAQVGGKGECHSKMFIIEVMSLKVWLLCSVLEKWLTSQLWIWLTSAQSEESPRRQTPFIQWIVILLHPRYEDNKVVKLGPCPLRAYNLIRQEHEGSLCVWNSWPGSSLLRQPTEDTVDLSLGSRALLNFIKSYRGLRWAESITWLTFQWKPLLCHLWILKETVLVNWLITDELSN